MGRIHIQKVESLNHIRKKPYPEPQGRTLISNQFRPAKDAMHVFVNPEAAGELFENIGWGQRTSHNIRELGGILVGYFYNAASEGEPPEIYVEVEHVIPCRHPQISEGAYLYMSADNWKEMYEKLDHMNEILDRKMVLVGWYHTHPDSIPTAFSGTDIETHSTKFTYPYSVGLVLNPQRKKWTVYYGPDCSEGHGVMMLETQKQQDKPDAGQTEKLKQQDKPDTGQTEKLGQQDEPDNRSEEKLMQSGKLVGNNEEDYWYWYQIQRNSPWGGSYGRYRVRAELPDSFKKDISRLAEWNQYNFNYLNQIGQRPEGIFSISVLKTGISHYSGMQLDSTLYLSSLKDVWEYEGDGYGKRLGFLAYRGYPGHIKNDAKLRRMLQMFELKYLILCNMEDTANSGYVFEGFLV